MQLVQVLLTLSALSLPVLVHGQCPKTLPDGIAIGELSEAIISSGGLNRTYLISLPPTYGSQNTTPVILSYHDGGQTAVEQLLVSQFSNPYFNDFAIVVYPQGFNNSWQGSPGASPTVDDIALTQAILNQLDDFFCIDSTSIWASGKGDGGGFVNSLACDFDLSQRIAAFAPVAGAFYVNDTTCNPNNVTVTCNPGRTNIPMLDFHDMNDTVVSYDGGESNGECLPAISYWIEQWAAWDNVTQLTTTPMIANTSVFLFGQGSQMGLVTQVSTINNDHNWPATFPIIDNTQPGQQPASFNATSIIVEYFIQNTL